MREQKMKCKICGNTKNNKAYHVLEMMYDTRQKFNYIECFCCGCLQIDDFPKDMEAYYPSNYYSFQNAEDVYEKTPKRKTRFDESILFPSEKKRFDFFKKRKEKRGKSLFSGLIGKLKKTDRILDVGCGSGRLPYALSRVGFKNLLGVDPFLEKDIRFKNGLEILKKDILDLPDSMKFDVIMFHHSLEHIKEQLKVLEKTKKLLSKNGFCLIRIPIASSWAWKHYRENWVQLDAPRHFFLHTVKSLEYLANKVGLELQDVKYDSYSFQFMGSEDYKSKLEKGVGRKFSKKEERIYARKSALLNEFEIGDQACFYLKHKKSK